MYSMVGADGKEYGPVDIAVLVEWTRQGRVVRNTTILDHDTGRRFLACDLEEVAGVLNPTSMVAPPVPEIVVDARTSGRIGRSRHACPRCGSSHTVSTYAGASRASFACCSCLFAPVFLPLLFFLPGKKRVCQDCGLEW